MQGQTGRGRLCVVFMGECWILMGATITSHLRKPETLSHFAADLQRRLHFGFIPEAQREVRTLPIGTRVAAVNRCE